jgi:hypothetical protein
MEPLTLRFAGGRVEGEGRDCIGPFTFTGTYTGAGTVSLLKRYVGQHAVRYEGRVAGEGEVVGRWSVSPGWSGPFGLAPLLDDVDQLPITALRAETT